MRCKRLSPEVSCLPVGCLITPASASLLSIFPSDFPFPLSKQTLRIPAARLTGVRAAILYRV